ncbi:uncharacterized protein LOC129738102 [Uranotaenia lowii]|uniref:uncharacterized protein LOC129738102 n=1 Tax=Uranotaenia lowii TaxID=190385 RepID=UPI0024786F1C|nr:uncharacterized protein LOC129738102 [Uranotaenia lowii]
MYKKKAAWVAEVQKGTRRNVGNHRQRKRQGLRILQEKKRRLEEEEELEELERLLRSQETRKLYQIFNSSRKDFVPQAEKCRDKDGGILTDNREVIKRWKQYFNEHLNGANAKDQDGGGSYIAGVANDALEPLPTMSEVKEAIHQLNSNKSTGTDGIAAELIKMGPVKLADCLHRLMVRIWDTEQLPEKLKQWLQTDDLYLAFRSDDFPWHRPDDLPCFPARKSSRGAWSDDHHLASNFTTFHGSDPPASMASGTTYYQ